MKIQKGIVKYKDRNDIVCTYGVTGDGKQYYFLDENDEKKLANGGRIASTELVEAIDPMVKASHIGVVGADGHEIIPFENKSIRPINDAVLLVEVSKPVSPSVLEAISLKSDPLSAAKLVSTPAAIKEKLNAKMGSDGRYLINDQFSEATICDIDGNNLINNELYSFAGISNGKVYLSKNIADAEIKEFSLSPEQKDDSVNSETTSDIDVTNVNVEKEVIDKAMDNAVSDIPPVVDEDTTSEEKTSNADDITIPSVEEEPEEEKEEIVPVVEDTKQEIASGVEENNEERTVSGENIDKQKDNVVVEDKLSSDEDKISSLSDDKKDETTAVVEVSSDMNSSSDVVVDEKSTDIDDIETEVTENDEDNDSDLDDFTSLSDDDDENDEVQVSFTEPQTASLPSVEDSLAETDDDVAIPDIFDGSDDEKSDDLKLDEVKLDDEEVEMKDSAFNVDKIETDDYYNEEFDSSYSNNASGNSIMSDVAKSLTSLMKQNRSQKDLINEYKDKIDKLNASRRVIVEKAKIQEQKIDALTNKNRNNENTISKLEAKLQMLESRIRDQEKIISNQSKELESIKPQKDDLAKLVADAQALLGDDISSSYTYDNSYFDKAA